MGNKDQAITAVREFKKLLPGLTSYARAVTGQRNVRIEIASTHPYTDGTTIYYRPPLSLGTLPRHDRSLCDRRDDATLEQRCPACAVFEKINIDIYHEIAHIAFGTFKQLDEHSKRRAIEYALKRTGDKRLISRMDALYRNTPVPTFIHLSNAVSPFLPKIINVLEDVRIDRRMYEARRGTKIMYMADTLNLLNQGVEQADGKIVPYSDYPLNHQAIVAMYVSAVGIDLEDRFDSKVIEAIESDSMKSALATISGKPDAEATYEASIDILQEMNKFGFFLTEEEQQDKSESSDNQSNQDEKSSDDSGDSDEQEQEEGDAKGESGQESSDETSGEEGSSSQDQSEELTGGSGEQADPDDQSEEGGSSGEQSDSDRDDSQDGSDADSSDSERGHGDDSSAGNGERSGSESDESTSSDSGDGPPDGGDNQPGEVDPDHLGSKPEGSDASSDSGDSSEAGFDEPEPVDTGADEGKGGIKAEENWGSADGIEEVIQAATGHHRDHDGEPSEPSSTLFASPSDNKLIEAAIALSTYFETSPINVSNVEIHRFRDGNTYNAWRGMGSSAGAIDRRSAIQLGLIADTDVAESVLGPALMQTRRTFDDNARAKHENNLKSGRINNRVLGRRAWSGDPRLFSKTTLPGKKSYAVVIGIDISGSTRGVNIGLAKRAAMAQAELCHRVGISFAVYAHSASSGGTVRSLCLDMYEIKTFEDTWDTETKKALEMLGPYQGNLDGHSVQFYRKMVERRPETEKIIMYYTDGKMPAANFNEELEVLQSEIRYCSQRNITLMGVGIRTDSPKAHGLDTVQVDTDSDLIRVVEHLQRRLIAG